MTEALQAVQIESPNPPLNSRKGDGSFERKLQEAIQNLIGGVFLSFDFRNEGFKETEKEEPSKVQSVQPEKHKEAASPQKSRQDDSYLLISDTKAIKDALIKFMPNPAMPLASPFPVLQMQNQPQLKTSLQFLIDQIVEQAKLLKTQKKVELKLLLSEKDLGEISLVFSKSGGLVSIQIGASEKTKRSIENSVNELESALNLAHIELGQIKIVEVKDERTFSG